MLEFSRLRVNAGAPQCCLLYCRPFKTIWMHNCAKRTSADHCFSLLLKVKTWFQNRRMKLKREVQDFRPEFLSVPAGLLPPLLFQHHVLSGQLRASSGFYPQLQPLHGAAPPAPLHPVILPPHFYWPPDKPRPNSCLESRYIPTVLSLRGVVNIIVLMCLKH